jgi:hypothetical protein
MLTLLNAIVVASPTTVTNGSKVIEKDPVAVPNGAPAPKPVALKLMVSVIIDALAVFAAPAPSAAAQTAASKQGSAFISHLEKS